ncbi:PF14133 domain protein [Peptostreptococcaceae bacterium AS15]|nr:PF14133 domain protein [Peptostreptococcaceae bacterium AS15]
MKKFKKLIGLCICAALAIGMTACNNSKEKPKVSQEPTTYSNLANKNSVDEVKSLLSAQLDKGSVEDFFKRVNEYNDIAGATGLTGDFKEFTTPQYDMDKISTLWREKMGDFIGTNCRINSYTLLKNNIEIPQIEPDDKILLFDNDAIDKGKVFNDEEKKKFQILFSRVKTEATQDVKIHAKNMEKYFENFKFNENARMLSVIIHDNLDGEYLFVGHVGVLVPNKDGFLFVEKLTFEEPYQAIKFATKEECYKYLMTKYKDYTGEGLAKPFIMDNNKMVEVK